MINPQAIEINIIMMAIAIGLLIVKIAERRK
jgi:hypothetical protein